MVAISGAMFAEKINYPSLRLFTVSTLITMSFKPKETSNMRVCSEWKAKGVVL